MTRSYDPAKRRSTAALQKRLRKIVLNLALALWTAALQRRFGIEIAFANAKSVRPVRAGAGSVVYVPA